MTQYNLLVDQDLCVGCRTCEIACKQENDLPVGPKWMRIVQEGPKEVGGKLVMTFHAIRCMNCGKAPCIDSCPTDAITKRTDGNVLIDPELCIGCMACIEACPFEAPQFHPETEVVGMCTLCVHRLDNGLKPACVLACPTGAILCGDVNEIVEQRRKEHAGVLQGDLA